MFAVVIAQSCSVVGASDPAIENGLTASYRYACNLTRCVRHDFFCLRFLDPGAETAVVS